MFSACASSERYQVPEDKQEASFANVYAQMPFPDLKLLIFNGFSSTILSVDASAWTKSDTLRLQEDTASFPVSQVS